MVPGGVTPNPDPSERTLESLEREILHLRELIEARLDQMDTALIEARSTTEKAVEAARITSQTAVSAAIDAAKTAIVEFDNSITRRLLAAAELSETKFLLIHAGIDSNREKTLAELKAATSTTDAKFDGVSKEYITLHTLLEANRTQAALALASTDKATDAAFASSKEAITKAEVFNEKRFDIITKSIDELKTQQSLSTGKGAGISALYGWLVAGIGLVITVIVFANSTFGQ